MRYKLILLIFFSSFLAACVKIPGTPLKLKLEASRQINLDATSQPLPVRIKIYQLNDATLFKEATFRSLWKSDVSVLGKTLLEKKVLTLNPGEQKTLKLPRNRQSEFLAVMAVFRRHHHNQWKSLHALRSPIHSILTPFVIIVSNNQVEIKS